MIEIAHLETDVTHACQLSCVACNHLVPLYREQNAKGNVPREIWRANPDQVSADLGHLAQFMRAGAWGALGGEPLLHPQLCEILLAARDSGIAKKIEVWTNGLLLPKMPSRFWESFDVLVLSVYDERHTPATISWATRCCEEAGIEIVVKDERSWHNFRTLFEPTPTDEVQTKKKFDGCFFRSFSRVANNGYFFTCCCAPHMPALMQGQPFGTDGVRIEGAVEADIQGYLNRSEPLGCCSICAGRDTAKPLAWSEEKDAGRWIERSAGRAL